MDIEEYKKLAKNKIEADTLTQQVRDVIKVTKWQKQDMREGFKETFKPLIESQESVKKSIDEQQNATIAQLQANQLALTQGLNQNRLAITQGLEGLIAEKFEDAEDDEGQDKGQDKGQAEEQDKEQDKGQDEAKKIININPDYYNQYLMNEKSQTILLNYGYDNLPSTFLNEGIIDIISTINNVSEDLKDIYNKKKTSIRLYNNNSGYQLATSISQNPREETKKTIDEYNTLSTYYTNLTRLKEVKLKMTGSGINYFNNPHQLIDRLELLSGSILAGNNGVINEFSQIAHLLNQMKVITKKQLNELIKTYITNK